LPAALVLLPSPWSQASSMEAAARSDVDEEDEAGGGFL
jgi:hypothetical protein